MSQFEDVTAEELAEEERREGCATVEDFMAQFVDNEPDALPIDVQVRRVLRHNMKRLTSGG